MTAIGGSIASVILDGREFPVAADADASRKLGGFENEVMANGDGSARQVKTRVPWAITGLTVEVDNDRGDQEFMQALADRNDFYPIAVTYPGGETYQGTGAVAGENPASSQSATLAIELSGPGKFTKQ